MATSWSFSRLGDFDKCKKYYWLKHEQKIPEPERPLPPGKTEHANDRGTRVHNETEAFVRGLGPFPKEMREFELEVNHLKALFASGRVSLEGEWGMDRDWNPTDWKTAWQRLKLDALVHVSKIEAIVIDYKTGRRFGNEVKHGQQLQSYQLNTFLRFPELEIVHAELWYPDVKDLVTQTFTRDQGLRFKRTFDERGKRLTSNTSWPANPNKFSCQWCPYGPDGTGHCPEGVRK